MGKDIKRWLHQHINDPYVKKAKVLGYRSRAAFKLIEIDKNDRLFFPGQTVIDLGAAPGAWSQVALSRVGPKGKVIALDLVAIKPLKGVKFIQGDFKDKTVLKNLVNLLEGKSADIVICDISPNISGIADVDQMIFYELANQALEFCKLHLNRKGTFLVKLFHGDGFEQFVSSARKVFKKVVTRKPQASRGRSKEMYLLCREVL